MALIFLNRFTERAAGMSKITLGSLHFQVSQYYPSKMGFVVQLNWCQFEMVSVSDSDSQFRIRKSNMKLENLKAILLCFKGNRLVLL